jgi:hypothetical protein
MLAVSLFSSSKNKQEELPTTVPMHYETIANNYLLAVLTVAKCMQGAAVMQQPASLITRT